MDFTLAELHTSLEKLKSHFREGWFERWTETIKNAIPTNEKPPDFIMDLGGGDFWTAQDAFEGTQIFGATGSGKTTGSGQRIALRMLRQGFGGLVLTVKADELETWKKYMLAADRPDDDLIVFEPGGDYTFNFLQYEAEAMAALLAKTPGVTLTDNLVALFLAVMEVSQRSQGGGNEAFWQKTLRQLLRNAIDLILYAAQPLNFQNIYNVIITAPTHPGFVENEEDEFSVKWREDSFCWQCLESTRASIDEEDPRHADALFTLKYWMKEFPNLDPETRSNIMIHFTSMADGFLRGFLRDLFSPADSTSKKRLDPEETHKGKVIVINLPVKHYNELGQFAQVLYKYVWQRATERRKPKLAGQRPVFLWADEAQFFVNSNDMMFQTTARSAQAATVYLTQNISNYYAIMPGEKGRAETDSLLGNFQTKIFHANGDSVTNLWAAELIGKAWDYRESLSSSVSSRENDPSSTQASSYAQTFEHQVLPKNFTTLKKGGERSDFWVDGFIFQGGRSWNDEQNTQRNYKSIKFKQEFLPELEPQTA